MQVRGKQGAVRRGVFLCLIAVGLMLTSGFGFGLERIKDIQISVELQQDGAAKIEQVWSVETNKGTEFYIPMTNMRDMEIEDFTVTDEAGREFSLVTPWDIDASFDQKAYKNGIHYISGGMELCWGKGSYGAHTYTLRYTMTNMVQRFSDYDGFLVRFVNDQMDPTPEHARIEITRADAGDQPSFVAEETGVYGFGYSGYINVLDGKIVAETDAAMHSSHHMTLMVRLPKGLLAPVSEGSGAFSELEERAKDGSDYTPDYDEEPLNLRSFFRGFVVFAAMLAWIIRSIVRAADTMKRPLYRAYKKQAPRYKDLDYYRDLPVGDRLDTAYFALVNGGKSPDQTDILGAYLLKLIRSGALSVQKEYKTTKLGREKEITSLALQDRSKTNDPYARALYDMIAAAAGGDRILQENELKRYAKRNFEKIDNWFDNIAESGENDFARQGGYNASASVKLFRAAGKELTDQGIAMISQVLGLRRFLEDFTLIGEREARDVALWDGYLIYAALFGIADRVAKEMQRIYPDFAQSSELAHTDQDLTRTLVMVHSMNRSMHAGYQSGKYPSEGGSRSSGGGGGASFGGGGGFSGGGSGGGSR